jgi:oligopeptidase A
MNASIEYFTSNHLSHPLPIHRIQANEIEAVVDSLVQQAQKDLQNLESLIDPCYKTLFTGLDQLGNQLDDYLVICSQLESLLDQPELRDAYQKVQPRVSAFYARLPFSQALYQHIQTVHQSNEFAQLTAEQQRYVRQTLDMFRRHGAELATDAKKRLEAIEVELSKKTLKFAQNVMEATDAFEHIIHQSVDLSGLPKSAIKAAKASAERKNIEGWRFTLQGPSYMAVMTYLDDAKVREVFYRAYSTRACTADANNPNLITEVLSLRQEKANILGYQDVADLYLAERMVKTGKAANDFVNTLTQRTQKFAQQEHQELLGFVHDHLQWEGKVQSWDIAYIAEKMRLHICDFDQELLRPYFEVNTVLSGMFEIVEKIFAIKVSPIDEIPTWHEDVKTYQVHDTQGRLRGIFYADLCAREGKQGGAWMCPLLYGSPVKKEEAPHVGLICGNFTPAVHGQSLITHREVETLFHEFGHLLHHLLGQSSIRSQAGTNVAWDFVELPSQIMENWCWEREALHLFAKHVDTQEALPDDLLSRLQAVRTFRQATAQMRQLCFANMDLQLHRTFAVNPTPSVLEYTRKLMQSFSPTKLPTEYAMVAGFTHLFASPVGYAAAYYSYKWAEVLDADAFTRFKQEGLFSSEVGQAFVDCILSRGDSEDPLELYRQFMHRDPDIESLFKRSKIGH